ncbi:right-handed parallel beta-helix repeat-containing protein [Adhaeribacter rhizoryzae]|uniref:T9SS type A sorting domain-containing protein n=1 Tax=Adhaeribacter rhizoryzae TaxID=2607907 RepID=A0A5M6DPA8_9BACT|nr:right-handed parallel beta-helix repeat-containing protein [Adhaeribacter rhizoryzae]KAA5548286.1 T9SS type A sorting domain-containing protein [Adhaeribacter rhizoryzae]
MKIHLHQFLPVLFLSLLINATLESQAQTVRYVAPAGTDAGNCPVGSPCATLNYAIQVASAGDVVQLAPGTYNQKATINKPITLQGAGAGTNPNVHSIITGNAPALSGRGITLAAGVANITIKDLRVQAFGGGSGIYGSGRNNNLRIQQVQVYQNLGGSSAEAGIHLNGPIADITLQNIDAQYNSTRGIVIWNGLKERITISNCTISNNNLAGLELQDGTASGITITDNIIQNNKDSGMSLVGLSAGAGANLITGNTLTNNGRFGIEVKLPAGNGQETGDGSILLMNNRVERTLPIAATELRDLAGIAVYRRNWTAANLDIPQGVVLKQNTVLGYRQASASDGFGIVVEGNNMQVLNNTVSGCDVAIQMQAGHLPYNALTTTDGDQGNLTDEYFGRGNTPGSSGVIRDNIFDGNITDTRYVGLPAPPEFDRTWIGTLSAEWGEASNWQEEAVPTATSDVIIPAGTPHDPIITDVQAVNNIKIAEGASLAVQEGALQLQGYLRNEGTLIQSNVGELTFTGVQRQTLGGTKTLEVQNLQVGAAGLELAGPINIKNKLSLNGTLYTNNFPLILLAGPAGTAQVTGLDKGNIAGLVTMQRKFAAETSPTTGYEILATPFTSASMQDFFGAELPENQALVQPFAYNEVRTADNSVNNFEQGWQPITNFNAPLQAGLAIRAKSEQGQTIMITGTLQNQAVEVSGLTRSTGRQSGWHLLGNPYAAPLDWRRIEVPAGMGHALYTLGESGNYNSYVNGFSTNAQEPLIQPMNGFFVRVQEGPVNFRFNPNQLANAVESPTPVQTENRSQLHLQIAAGAKKDVTIIYFEAGATAQPDSRYDAYKLPAVNATDPMVYSQSENEKLAINGLANLEAGQAVVIPMGVSGKEGEEITLQARLLLNFAPNLFIFLEDRETGIFQNLRENPVYNFNLSSPETTNRFFIHFTPDNISVKEAANTVAVYPNPVKGFLQVSLNGLNQEQSVAAVLYNNLGQVVFRQMLPVRNGRVAEKLNLANQLKGVHVLHLQTQQGIIQRKIVLQ